MFHRRSVKMEEGSLPYQAYLPPEWHPDREWPVVLFLHGAGERGSDGLQQTLVGIGPVLRAHPERFPCIVVLPQCPLGRWWPEPDLQAAAVAAIEQACAEFNGDAQRMYLTGISMGAYGVWGIAYSHPGRFAALVPVCGGIRPPAIFPTPTTGAFADPLGDPYRATAEKAAATPAWIFHGVLDRCVPVSESRRMVQALREAGADPRYTEYPAVGHNSWDRAYNEANLMPWLLSLRRAPQQSPRLNSP